MTNLSTNIQKEIIVRSCRREIVKEIERQKKDRRKGPVSHESKPKLHLPKLNIPQYNLHVVRQPPCRAGSIRPLHLFRTS